MKPYLIMVGALALQLGLGMVTIYTANLWWLAAFNITGFAMIVALVYYLRKLEHELDYGDHHQ